MNSYLWGLVFFHGTSITALSKAPLELLFEEIDYQKCWKQHYRISTICNENHPIYFCSDFLRMSVIDRLLSVKDHKSCSSCLAVSHEFKSCRAQTFGKCVNIKFIRYFTVSNLSSRRDLGLELTSSLEPSPRPAVHRHQLLLLFKIFHTVLDSCIRNDPDECSS